MPLAHTEGGLSASLYRGARAAAESGGFRTWVVRDRMTRASCFVCALDRGGRDALALPRGARRGDAPLARRPGRRRPEPVDAGRSCARSRRTSSAPMCHVMWAWTTGDACGPNMMTRNAYALNMGYVLEHAPVKPRAGDPRGEHGRRQEAVAPLLRARRARQDRARGGDALGGVGAPRVAHDRRRPARPRVGGHARRGRVRDAVGRLHSRVGGRGGLRRHRPGPRHGRDELDGARHRPPRRGRAPGRRSACRGSRSAPSAAARPFPTRAPGSS